MNKYGYLKGLITDAETLIVPDAYDGISAKIIEYCGFHAAQCSGYSFSFLLRIGRIFAERDHIKLNA
ncbi:MAG: hypothetical protein JXA35_10830 [Deltaproteobacteria bacterium]|nr:hypothetical protein [Deltaproteobacteria bacterium]